MKDTYTNLYNLSEEGPHVSVLMPTFNQAAFIRRALESLRNQTMTKWELIVVNDGSTDNTHELIAPYLNDVRIHYYRIEMNQGLGAALNYAVKWIKAPLVAYLPSDDVYFTDHLESLIVSLNAHPEAVLSYSRLRHEVRLHVLKDVSSLEQVEGIPLQLVQVMHRFTPDRWVERSELVTDDLDRMFWSKLRQHGIFVSTNKQSCHWIDHPQQRHKVLQEPLGGINPYRLRYNVKHPLRFHTTKGSFIDEVEHYRRFRERTDTPFAHDGLKILLVGELAFNPERVLALEERGHKLYGLWTSDGHWFNTVGSMPFGHVEDLPQSGWREAVRKVNPDIIYALLNWEAVPFAHEVLTNNSSIPFVWHFKEGPFECIAHGTWPQLVDLFTYSDGQIYTSPEMRDWFSSIFPNLVNEGRSFVLDGDLPKQDWFTLDRSLRLSKIDGKIHTIIIGAPMGLETQTIAQLARQDIHLHFYGDFYHKRFQPFIEETKQIAPNHIHLHPQVYHEQWVSELSQYDAGWLHILKSENAGDLHQANWGDLNYPARIPTLIAAGVPLIQYDNKESVVAMQSLAQTLDIGLFYKDVEHLIEQLRNGKRMQDLRENVWNQREKFTFDYYADSLIDFFRQVIAAR